MKDKIKKLIQGTSEKILDPFYIGGAAELAFWLLLSLIPATILLAQLLQIFTLSMDAANNILEVYLTKEIYELIAPLLRYSPRGGVTIILIVLAAWAGSSAVFTLMRTTNRAYGTIPKTKNQVLRVLMDRLRAVLMTLLILVTIIFALYILVFGELLVQAVISYNNTFLGREYAFSDIWFGIRWIIALVLFFFMSYSIYIFLPNMRRYSYENYPGRKRSVIKTTFKNWLESNREEVRRALPGSIFSAVLMLLATWLYTQYIRSASFGNFNILYGGLSSVVVLLLWFYIISYIVITGIQINATFAELGFLTKTREKKHD